MHTTKQRTARWLLAVLCILPDLAGHAQTISRGESFSFSDLGVSVVTDPNGTAYTQLSYPDLMPGGAPGHPALPVRYINLIVPAGKDYSDITVTLGGGQNVPLKYAIVPTQEPYAPSAQSNTAPAFTNPDAAVYKNQQPYPAQTVQFVRDGYFDGNNHIVTLAVCPVQYLPFSNKAVFYSTISFDLNENVHGISRFAPITRKYNFGSSTYENALSTLVVNSTDIVQFGSYQGRTQKRPDPNSPFYEYVIITSKELAPAFEELKGWKRRKGLWAGIVYIEDILSDPQFAAGDPLGPIQDDAGKVRAYLRKAYENGTQYALLGGNSDIIPIRHGDPSSNGSTFPEWNIPTDLYYSDLNGNWNADGNSTYGGPVNGSAGDQVDVMPEIFVGRIFCHTQTQATNHIHKIIGYERNPGKGDAAYLTRAFFTQSDQLLEGDEAGLVGTALTNYFPTFNVNTWNETPSFDDPAPTGPSGTAAVLQMANYCGLVSLFGHGGPYNVNLATPNINGCDWVHNQMVTSLSGLPFQCYAPPALQQGYSFDNLDDYNHYDKPYFNYPNVHYSVACETMPFDIYLKNAVADNDMGQVITNYSKAGAAAYLGNTRYGYVGYSTNMFKVFLKFIHQGNYKLGVAEGLSKTNIANVTPIEVDGYYYLNFSHNLIGCPETNMWVSKPKYQEDVQVIKGAGYVTVTTNGAPGVKICVMSYLDNGQSYFETVDNASTSTSFTNVPAASAICITRDGYVPFLVLSTIAIQNKQLAGAAYIAADNIRAGQAVESTQNQGVTKILTNANVIFHAEQTITLDKGFEVEPGAEFEAK